jgi:hypothetical protein
MTGNAVSKETRFETRFWIFSPVSANPAINPHGASAAVFKTIKQHFSCSAWMNKDSLTQKWEAMRVCTDPEATNNDLLALNQECKEAGSGFTDFQVASKCLHLLQANHDHAYIHLLNQLARTGENSSIRDL